MFSVIIPAYNAAYYIRQSIGSVLAQTVSDFEIVVVDDGSIDETKAVVESIGDMRVRYIRQENGGVSAARNTGIQNAKGEYVCFLDADDRWKPHHLETVGRMIEMFPSCGVYITGHELLLHDGEIIDKPCRGVDGIAQIDNVYKHIWDYGYFFNTNSMICKASVFDRVGLFEVGVKNGEDDDMWYRLFAYYSVAVTNEVTTTYVRENSRATVSRVFVDDWAFLSRVDEIMASAEVSKEKKAYLRRLLEQRKLSKARNCILRGDKKTARRIIKQLHVRLLRPKKYIETLIALLIPSAFSAKAVNHRDRKYYSE